jgi:murein DD-endopeptidase MepM/ murein hydrolase activator NlpD
VKRVVVLLVVAAALVSTTGVARGDGQAFSVVSSVAALPSAAAPNGPDLGLAPNWTTPPANPVQLSYDALLGIWQSAGQAYGIPWNVLAAINKIESNFGRNMGPSSAGAVGWMQFMPSTWVRWGTDADRDGIADPWNPQDAIYSAARYLAASGAASDLRRAIFSYNHAWWYVEDVLELAELYGGSGGVPVAQQPSAAVGLLQTQLASARAAVAQASAAYLAARENVKALATQERALQAEVDREALLSDRLEAQQRVTQQGAGVYAAQAEADRLKAELDAAQAALTALEGQAQASYNLSAGAVGTYVFPVGGGPSVVSVSHTHHDYPAADIAAPEGSPLVALTDGVVLYAWSSDERCGIGFTMQATDGQTWTYCHLSYLYPTVAQGALLRVGDPVGLVGSTGRSTGPHLHLQLQPADRYPQEQPWFQASAGTSFQWQDGAPAATLEPAPLPVFEAADSAY